MKSSSRNCYKTPTAIVLKNSWSWLSTAVGWVMMTYASLHGHMTITPCHMTILYLSHDHYTLSHDYIIPVAWPLHLVTWLIHLVTWLIHLVTWLIHLVTWLIHHVTWLIHLVTWLIHHEIKTSEHRVTIYLETHGVCKVRLHVKWFFRCLSEHTDSGPCIVNSLMQTTIHKHVFPVRQLCVPQIAVVHSIYLYYRDPMPLINVGS